MAASKGSSNFSTATSSLNFDLGSKPPRTSNSFSGGTDSLFSDHKTQYSNGFGDIFGGSARFADKSDGRGTSDAAFNLDSMFSTSRSVNLPPVYDKPMYAVAAHSMICSEDSERRSKTRRAPNPMHRKRDDKFMVEDKAKFE